MLYRATPRSAAFTLVEVMVSTALVVAIMVLLLSTVDQTQKVWQRARSKASQFQSARNAFDSMARRMSQATLNTYWRAHEIDVTNSRADYLYRRQGEFQFISAPAPAIFNAAPILTGLNAPADESYPTHAVFFHAPLGYTTEIEQGTTDVRRFRALDSLMAATGYFIEFGDDPDLPTFLREMQPPYPAKYRYRLVELTLPAEKLNIYERPQDDTRLNDPRIFNERNDYYEGLVNTDRSPVASYVRPLWMRQALARELVPGSSSGQHRFKHGHVMADNIVALIILPKLAERDRRRRSSSTSTQPDPDYLELAPHFMYDSWRTLSGGTATDPITRSRVDNRARENLLPPTVQLTMIAIDEPSALRMNASPSKMPKWTQNRFKRVETVQQFDEEMESLTEAIQKDPEFPNINFRVFTTDVVIRGSKWSRDPGR
jgi:uncharacterized protein (TIGR02599 family)